MLWRSLLAQSRPILSHLCPPMGGQILFGPSIRHFSTVKRDRSLGYEYSDYSDNEYLDDTTAVPPLATADDPGARQPLSQHQCGRCGGPNRQQHLYVVVDDWSEGFSIHKIDLADDVDIRESVVGSEAEQQTRRQSQRLPPPVLRMAFSNIDGAGLSFAALGNKIVFSMGAEDDCTIVYDTNTRSQTFARRRPQDELRHNNWDIAVAAGNSLYALVPNICRFSVANDCWGPEEMYYLQENIIKSTQSPSGMPDDSRVSKQWSFRRHPSPLPFPKDQNIIVSFALHPNGQTFFLSTTPIHHSSGEVKEDTYSFDTKSGKWDHHGTWGLPFPGKGHYDSELDAWVWLYAIMDRRRMEYKLGCSDVVPPPGAEGASTMRPCWKLCEGDLTSLPTDFSGLDTRLVPMGSGWFCLVECRQRDANGPYRCLGDGDKFELCVITFRARYGKNGELLITDRRLSRSYVLSRYIGVHDFPLHAFWM